MKKILLPCLLIILTCYTGKTQSEENKAPSTSAKDSFDIMYLNAYNFDFGHTSLSSNYVGHLNVYKRQVSGRWGFNSGIMKINYGQNDSTTNERQAVENILISPFTELKAGEKYLRQLNSYKTKRSNTVWSFYAQPLFRLTKASGRSSIHLHGHMELLAAKWTSKTTITSIKHDTAIFVPANGFVAKSILSEVNTSTIHSLSGYFGGGLTFDLRSGGKGSFFFQPTFGVTSNYPQPTSVDINNPVFPTNNKGYQERKWHTFYLFRAYYKHEITPGSVIIVGTDIRGLLPLYAPLYAGYVGINLSVDKIFTSILGDGGKSNQPAAQ